MAREFLSKAALGVVAAAMTAVLATSAGCGNKAPDPVNSVSGNVVYRPSDRVSFSDEAVAYVRLADVTKGTVNSTTVVQKQVRPDASGAIPFELVYKEKQIDPRREYAIDVRVVDRGRLMFISDGKHPVITQGHGNELALQLERPGGK